MKSYEIRKVLVPIDFSKVALNALATAVEICKRQSSTLTVINVVENLYPMFPPDALPATGTMLSELMQIKSDHLVELVKELYVKHGIIANSIVQTGNPADEICTWAWHNDVDLIVIGTHGTSGLREFFIGSNAYRVVKNAPCPVMTIPGTSQWLEFRKILFPVRLIPHALDKYDAVRPIIKRDGSSLSIAGLVHQEDQAGLVEMNVLVDYVKSKIDDDNVICGGEVHYCHDIAKQVLALAKLEKPDLVVITATLDESVHDFFLGPYTQEIVHHSQFPVLSIRPGIPNNTKKTLTEEIVSEFESLYQKD